MIVLDMDNTVGQMHRPDPEALRRQARQQAQAVSDLIRRLGAPVAGPKAVGIIRTLAAPPARAPRAAPPEPVIQTDLAPQPALAV